MAKFEKVEYIDGGPNDRGEVIGYIEADTLEKAREILNVDHGFTVVRAISEESYYNAKQKAEERLNQFKI